MKSNEIRIKVQCINVANHAKILRFDPQRITLAFIESLAALIDGTHPAYIHPPNPGPDATVSTRRCEFCNEFHPRGVHSPIGRCALCGGILKCEIERVQGPSAPHVGKALRASLEEEHAELG